MQLKKTVGKKEEWVVKVAEELVDIEKIEKEIMGAEKDSDTFRQLRQVAENLKTYRAEQQENEAT